MRAVFAIASFLFLLYPLHPLALDFTLIASYEVEVPEPSGLAYDPVRDVLYTISDEGGPIVILSKEGRILGEIGHFKGDLEGIAYDHQRGLFYIAEEQRREIIIFDRKAGTERRLKVDLMGYNKPDNKGIEGVAVDPKSGRIFVVKERDPHFLLEIDAEGKSIQAFTIQEAWDFSDVSYDQATGHLLILSRGSRKVYEVTTTGKLVGKPFSFNFFIFNAEGITLDRDGNLYLITDSNGFAKDYLLKFERKR